MGPISTWELVHLVYKKSTSMKCKPLSAFFSYMWTAFYVKRGEEKRGKEKKGERKEGRKKEEGGGGSKCQYQWCRDRECTQAG